MEDEKFESSENNAEPQSRWKSVVKRLIGLPWLVKGVMFTDLGASIAFHVVKILVMCDLYNINYYDPGQKRLLILSDEYYGATKSHFWALCGVACELNLHTTSVAIWGILAFGIVHADPSWVRAWCMLRRVLIFILIIPNLTITFGGSTHFTLVNTIVFFVYYLEAVLAIEVVSRYYVNVKTLNSLSVLKTNN